VSAIEPCATDRPGLVLEGIPGDNPLGFLAALGVLRTLSQRWPGHVIRMRWQARGGWRPVIERFGPVERPAGPEVLRAGSEASGPAQDGPPFPDTHTADLARPGAFLR
jgi:hypothetical protein